MDAEPTTSGASMDDPVECSSREPTCRLDLRDWEINLSESLALPWDPAHESVPWNRTRVLRV